MIRSLLFILYCLEAALFLIIVPWTSFWSESVVLVLPGWLGALFQGMFIRGLVSGIGVVHIYVAIREVLLLVSGDGRVGDVSTR